MNLFVVGSDNKLRIREGVLIVKEFKTLWDGDASEDKRVFGAELKFMYLSRHWESPYWGMDRKKRIVESHEQAFPKDWHWEASDDYDAAAVEFDRLQVEANPQIRLLNQVRGWFGQIGRRYDDPDEEGGLKKVIDLKEVMEILKTLPEAYDECNELEKKVMAKNFQVIKAVGSKDIGHFEKV